MTHFSPSFKARKSKPYHYSYSSLYFLEFDGNFHLNNVMNFFQHIHVFKTHSSNIVIVN